MGVRTFIIENAIGDSINLTENIDLFAFSPEGLGIEIENDLISSGGSFLVNKREITPGELTLSLLLGALQENPYGAYSRFIDILSKPPYILRYKTPVGEWSRSCILSALSKSEINNLNVMTEQVKFQFTTPWFRYVYNEYPVPPTQLGDGKIYNKHTNWIYATDGYKSAPLTGYKLNEYWTYDPSVIFPGRNIANNMYYDQLEISGNSVSDSFTILAGLAPTDATFMGFEADIEVVKLSNNVSITFNDSNTIDTIDSSKRHIRATGITTSGSNWSIALAGMTNTTDRIILKNIYISYTTDSIQAGMVGRFSEPVYWNSRDMNILGRQDGAEQHIFSTSDGTSDTRLNYSVIPANYPRHKPYIYGAEYEFDYKFKDWYVTADKISIDSLELTAGQIFNYSAYFGNSPNSEANLSIRMVFLKGGQQMHSIESGVSISRGNYDMVKMDNVILPTGATYIEIQIYKTGDTHILNMGATYSAKRIFVNNLEPVLLLATKTNSILVESDWILAENPDKVAESVHYGYIYNYVYDDDEKAANVYLIENNSLYLRTKVNSPCEITIHGPAKNPRWEVLIDSQITMTDGFNLSIPRGWKLIVSSFPNEQRAILVDPAGVESNVYQQQILSYTNFVRIPPGLAILMVYGVDDKVDFRYREERDVV